MHDEATLPPLLAGYLTRDEVARQLKVNPRTISRYSDQPDGLPFLRVGGRLLYRRDDVREFLDRRLQRPNPGRR